MIDWSKLFKFAVLELKIQPSEFWQMTVKEFMVIASNSSQEKTINKAELAALLKKFPDSKHY